MNFLRCKVLLLLVPGVWVKMHILINPGNNPALGKSMQEGNVSLLPLGSPLLLLLSPLHPPSFPFCLEETGPFISPDTILNDVSQGVGMVAPGV